MAIVFVGIDLAKNVFAVHGDLPTGSYLRHRPKPRSKPVCRCAVCSSSMLSLRAADAGHN
jgi:hypothetical protein